MELKRKIYQKLLNWKNKSNGKSALLIEGARRIGKSYICNAFGKKEYKSYITIDFGNISKEMIDLFENESSNLDFFFAKLSAFYGVTLYNRNSLIIFDEVQNFPRARQLIKYLVEDGRYDFIETGSLIRLKKNVKNIIIPSEEKHIEMFPLDFEEFLWAMGDKTSIPFIRDCFNNLSPLGQTLHRKIMNLFRQYILVGGMPQAVIEYVKTNQFEGVDEIKKDILLLYRSDISKYTDNEAKVFSIFDSIHSQLSRSNKKFRFSDIGETRYRDLSNSFDWLKESMIINSCLNCTNPNVALATYSDSSNQKIFMGDTGLLISQTFNGPYSQNELYKAVLFDKIEINEGMIMENIVAQSLRASGYNLYYYTQSDNINRANNMKIDFLITDGEKIIPIEVKSGDYRSHSSLDKFIKKFSSKVGTPYILYTKDVMIKDGIIHLPLYMTMFL